MKEIRSERERRGSRNSREEKEKRECTDAQIKKEGRGKGVIGVRRGMQYIQNNRVVSHTFFLEMT